MKISWIKYEKDNKNFRVAENLGLDVFRIQNLEDVDSKMQELINNNYKTIILSNDVAGFSEDIIKKYQKQDDVNIIISPRRQA